MNKVWALIVDDSSAMRKITEGEPIQWVCVGLAGQVCGVLSMRCTISSATLMASKMLGVDPADVGEQVWDAVGEVSNMIAGIFKNKITGLGDGCMLSVPTAITGADFSLHSLADAPPFGTRLRFSGQLISVSLEIHS
ncbi:MAG TPA: chemotaxis protein CheX [Terriglobales bacterium]|nr:chemotaxis protein CheX [Terriglobales bacterium]